MREAADAEQTAQLATTPDVTLPGPRLCASLRESGCTGWRILAGKQENLRRAAAEC